MTIAVVLGKYSPSKEESLELIEECRRSVQDLTALLEVAIPLLIESDKQKELYTLLAISFSDLKASLEGIEMGTEFLKLHTLQLARECKE